MRWRLPILGMALSISGVLWVVLVGIREQYCLADVSKVPVQSCVPPEQTFARWVGDGGFAVLAIAVGLALLLANLVDAVLARRRAG